jgi:hypothetical protein
MVMHGYQRPGWGELQGKCYGVGYPPFELSSEGTKHLLGLLETRLSGTISFLTRLKNNEVQELYVPQGNKMVKILPEDPSWKHTFDVRVRETGRAVESLKKDTALFEKMISTWTEQELPKEGSPIKPPPTLLQ